MRQAFSTIGLTCAVMLCATAPALLGDEYNKRTDITINNPVEVPGAVLQPGMYTFKLIDYPSDRHIVEISSTDGKTVYAVIFTAAARRVRQTGTPTMTFYEGSNGRPPAVNEWFWPGELDGQQFLYPHKQATIISQSTGKKVPESPEESNQPGLVSQNQAPTPPTPAQPPATQPNPAPGVAETAPAPAPPPAPSSTQPAPQQVAQATPPPPPVSQNPPANENTQLPQTASDLPLIGLIGLISISAAMAAHSLRRARAMR
jgi:hypothetical protein